MLIRPARESDLDLISGLESLLFPEGALSEEQLEKELRIGRAWVSDGGEGYVLCAWGPDFVDILRLGVHPEKQCMGVGRALLLEVLARATLSVTLTVKKNNGKAIKLYRSEKFNVVASMPHRDALVMMRR